MLLGGKNKFPCTVIASAVGHDVPAGHIKHGAAVYFVLCSLKKMRCWNVLSIPLFFPVAHPKSPIPAPLQNKYLYEERSGGTTHLRTFFIRCSFHFFMLTGISRPLLNFTTAVVLSLIRIDSPSPYQRSSVNS